MRIATVVDGTLLLACLGAIAHSQTILAIPWWHPSKCGRSRFASMARSIAANRYV